MLGPQFSTVFVMNSQTGMSTDVFGHTRIVGFRP